MAMENSSLLERQELDGRGNKSGRKTIKIKCSTPYFFDLFLCKDTVPVLMISLNWVEDPTTRQLLGR